MKLKRYTPHIVFGLFLMLLFSSFLYLISLHGILAWDEVVYLANARNYLSESNFTEDFRFPLLNILIAGVWFFTGESVFVAQLLMIFISLSSVIMLYFVAKEFFPRPTAMLAAATFGITLQFLTWGYRIYTDLLGITLFLAGVLCVLKFLRKEKVYLLVLSGFFGGLACTARLSTLVVSAVIGIWILFQYRKFFYLVLYGIGFLIPLIPWFIQGYVSHKNPFYFVTAQTAVIFATTTPESPLLYLRAISYEFGLALFVLFFVGFYFLHFLPKKILTRNVRVQTIIQKSKHFREKYTHAIILIGSIVFLQLLFYMFFINLKLERYILELSVFIVILLYLGYTAIVQLDTRKITQYFVLGVIIGSVLFSTSIGMSKVLPQAICTSEGALVESIAFLQERITPEDIVVSSVWPYYGYYLNVRVGSFWTSVDDHIDKYNVSWFVLSKQAGVTASVEHPRIEQVAYFEDACGWDLSIYEVI